MAKVLGFLALWSLIGCVATDNTIDIVHDPCEPLVLDPAPDATLPERESISAAMELWRAKAEARLTLDEVPGAMRLPIRFESAALAFYGLYDDEEGIVFVNRELEDSEERAVTITHEIGHSFGLVHVDRSERSSVMNPANLDVLPTPEDIEALSAIWGPCEAE
ncbi:MAG: hypothetical protein HYY06_30160 [Deltaproteobacteria bacterium]|nr:hypothetical protein [Deltaproteobacteria bacterium]